MAKETVVVVAAEAGTALDRNVSVDGSSSGDNNGSDNGGGDNNGSDNGGVLQI